MSRILQLILFISVITSCNFKPYYDRPCTDFPESWRYPANESSAECNLDWWKQFNDPILDQLIDDALMYNYDLRAAAARVWEFYAQYLIVRSQLFPQIDGTASAYRQELSALTNFIPPGVPRISNVFSTLLNLNWELDVWGQLRNETEASLYQLFAEQEIRRTVVLTVVSSVAETYLLLLQYDKQLIISRDTYKSRVESFELAKLRFEGGVTSEMPVKQAESEVEDAAVQVINYEQLVQETENLLSILVGHAPSDIRRSTLDQMGTPFNVPAGIPSDIIEQRPDIRRAEDLLIAANANIGAAIAQYFPQLTLTGFYGNQSTQLSKLFSGPARTWQYGMSMLQPIYTGGRLTAQVEYAEALYCEELNIYQQTILTALKEVNDALIAHQQALQLIKVQAKNVVVLTEYLHLANLQYDNGQTDYLNVLDAQRKLFGAQLNYAEAQGASLITIVELYRSLGGGWVVEADPYNDELPACDPFLF